MVIFSVSKNNLLLTETELNEGSIKVYECV